MAQLGAEEGTELADIGIATVPLVAGTPVGEVDAEFTCVVDLIRSAGGVVGMSRRGRREKHSFKCITRRNLGTGVQFRRGRFIEQADVQGSVTAEQSKDTIFELCRLPPGRELRRCDIGRHKRDHLGRSAVLPEWGAAPGFSVHWGGARRGAGMGAT